MQNAVQVFLNVFRINKIIFILLFILLLGIVSTGFKRIIRAAKIVKNTYDKNEQLLMQDKFRYYIIVRQIKEICKQKKIYSIQMQFSGNNPYPEQRIMEMLVPIMIDKNSNFLLKVFSSNEIIFELIDKRNKKILLKRKI